MDIQSTVRQALGRGPILILCDPGMGVVHACDRVLEAQHPHHICASVVDADFIQYFQRTEHNQPGGCAVIFFEVEVCHRPIPQRDIKAFREECNYRPCHENPSTCEDCAERETSGDRLPR